MRRRGSGGIAGISTQNVMRHLKQIRCCLTVHAEVRSNAEQIQSSAQLAGGMPIALAGSCCYPLRIYRLSIV
jgi:hypothetical protein